MVPGRIHVRPRAPDASIMPTQTSAAPVRPTLTRNRQGDFAMEQKFNAPVDKVYALLTDPKWIEARSLALGELSATVKAKKKGGGVALSMKRRVRRELPGMLAKVLSPESDLLFEETWAAEEDECRSGTLTMDAVGQPVKMTAEFELASRT
jgi:hypothetical protein